MKKIKNLKLMPCLNPMKVSKGFTLLEVLISAIILFSALALISEIFKGAMLSTDKTVINAKYYQVTPSAITAIKTNLRSSVKAENISFIQGEVLLFDIVYSWQANRTIFNSAPTNEFSDFREDNRFSVYQVDVIAKFDNRERQFSFEVATW
ncbi:type IV pilus modification PilV family protein [Pseudoalteromonas tunicata]|uniref:type IV pilus modification PilV family protein n=2 Tax=Pseudoalteromonas tunicata TaxID=314281 RepID=UPI00273DFF5B|nr:prepilin-type N-terminal cleavage/methylation domain-containing protein [Pseudoalteromonas tunicata]MDP4985455.1 prepilin-type N-terminal cleavage/methylation domain-containing protein [Pseudoalteromonas tunicata]